MVPAIREIGQTNSDFRDYSGAGLISRLAQAQNPNHDRREDRILFDRINGFIQVVSDHPEAKIEIPHSREHILVHIDGKVLPLRALGTGIQ